MTTPTANTAESLSKSLSSLGCLPPATVDEIVKIVSEHIKAALEEGLQQIIQNEIAKNKPRFEFDGRIATASKTCKTCFHFNPEPYFAFDMDMPAGCGEAHEQSDGIDPVTGKEIFREVVSSDPACHRFLTEQEGHLWEAWHGQQFENRYKREAAKMRFSVIQGGAL